MNKCPSCGEYAQPYEGCLCENCATKKSVAFGQNDKLVKPVKPLSIDDYIVPENKTEAILSYYTQLRKKYVHIKQERLIKKVAEYFHLKKKAEQSCAI